MGLPPLPRPLSPPLWPVPIDPLVAGDSTRGFSRSALMIHLRKLPFFGLALSKLGFVIHRVFKHNAKARGRKAWIGEQTRNPKPSAFMPGERVRAPGRRPEQGGHLSVRGKLCEGGREPCQVSLHVCSQIFKQQEADVPSPVLPDCIEQPSQRATDSGLNMKNLFSPIPEARSLSPQCWQS